MMRYFLMLLLLITTLSCGEPDEKIVENYRSLNDTQLTDLYQRTKNVHIKAAYQRELASREQKNVAAAKTRSSLDALAERRAALRATETEAEQKNRGAYNARSKVLQEAEVFYAVRAARILTAIKESLHNPKSFEYIGTTFAYVDDTTPHHVIATIRFRGENGFGALRVGEQKIKIHENRIEFVLGK